MAVNDRQKLYHYLYGKYVVKRGTIWSSRGNYDI